MTFQMLWDMEFLKRAISLLGFARYVRLLGFLAICYMDFHQPFNLADSYRLFRNTRPMGMSAFRRSSSTSLTVLLQFKRRNMTSFPDAKKL